MKNSSFYNLDEAMEEVNQVELNLNTTLKYGVIIEILKKNKITNDEEINACEDYLKQTSMYKKLVDDLETMKSKIKEYQTDPQQHLKDLYHAKMRGNIK